jgi:hypothetical protein
VVKPANRCRAKHSGKTFRIRNTGFTSPTYHIGCITDKDIQFSVIANTGGDLFGPEWISPAAIGQ